MALNKLVFKPGINRDQTNYSSEGGWFDADKIRFRSGFPEKIGGWIVTTFEPYVGVARSVFPWVTTNGYRLLAIGTNEKIYIVAGTQVRDITPIRATYDSGTTPSTDNCFSTADGSATIQVNITAHGAVEGDYVTFSGAVAVGGVPADDLNKEFKVSSVTTSTFEITVDTPATSSTSGGGTAIEAEFQINIGNVNVSAGYGWSTGGWGRGGWGSGTLTPLFSEPRLSYFQNFNNDLIFNIGNGDIYYWQFTTAVQGRAVLLSSIGGAVAVPEQVGRVLFSSSGYLMAFRATNYDPLAVGFAGDYDPLLVRWADVNPDIGPRPEYWKPELTNTAGFLRLQAGSEIITAENTRQETLVWTDVALYSIQFLGTAEVFGQQLLSANTSILGPNAVVTANNVTYWMGNDKFYSYTGRVDTLPCTVRQYVFEDMNRTQGQIFFAGGNAQFNEIIWFYSSKNAIEIDRYVIYNYAENLWYFGTIERTAWVDAGINQNPLAVAGGWVYEHEVGHDDGQPLGNPPQPLASFIQSADVDIADGDQFILTRRIIPDINFTASDLANVVTGDPITPEVDLTIGVRDFPGAAQSNTNARGGTNKRDVTTTVRIDQYTNQVFLRTRGRQMSFRINSSGVGVQWQLGMPRVDGRVDGRK